MCRFYVLPPGCYVHTKKMSDCAYAVGIDAALRQEPSVISGADRTQFGLCLYLARSTLHDPENLDQTSEFRGI